MVRLLQMAILFVLLVSAVAAYAQKNLRVPSTMQELVINSNVKQATILKNGFFLGNVGNALDISRGDHEVTVTSPGYVPRIVKVTIGSVKRTTLVVNLAKEPAKRSIDAVDFEGAWQFKAKRSIVDLKSLCHYIKPPKLPPTLSYNGKCDRQSWVEDLEYAGYRWLLRPDYSGLDAANASTVAGLVFSAYRAGNTDWYRTAEGQFGLWPGNELVYGLLGKSALLRQDCGRVYQILHEHGMHGIIGLSLRGIAAHCMELEGRDDQAISLLERLKKEKYPEASYHIARILYPKDPGQAVKELTACTKEYETYLPCHEALAMHLLRNRRFKLVERLFDNYDEAVRKVLGAFFNGIYKDQEKFTYANKLLMLTKAKAAAPYSYTLSWELLLTIAEQTKLSSADYDAMIGSVHLSDVDNAKRLIPRIRQLNKTEYLEDLYWHFTEKYPRNPIYWLKLAQIKKRKSGCGEAMQVIDKALAQKLKSRRGLKGLRGDCLISLGRYPEAQKIFRELIKDDPDNWKPFWNLGIVMEEMGNRERSIYFFREALMREPPETQSMQLLRKIEYLERVSADQ